VHALEQPGRACARPCRQVHAGRRHRRRITAFDVAARRAAGRHDRRPRPASADDIPAGAATRRGPRRGRPSNSAPGQEGQWRPAAGRGCVRAPERPPGRSAARASSSPQRPSSWPPATRRLGDSADYPPPTAAHRQHYTGRTPGGLFAPATPSPARSR
jgi:hypothetical protein